MIRVGGRARFIIGSSRGIRLVGKAREIERRGWWATDVGVRVGSRFPAAAGEETKSAAGETGNFDGRDEAIDHNPGVVLPGRFRVFRWAGHRN